MFIRTLRATCVSLFVIGAAQAQARDRYLHRPTLTGPAGAVWAMVLGVCLVGAPSGASAQTAEEIIAANIAASGGREAIARIENVTSTGRVTVESPIFGQFAGTLEVVRVPGRGYYESVELGPIAQQKGWDGARAWERGPAGLRMLDGHELSTIVEQSFINPLVAALAIEPAGLRIERLDDSDVNGRPHYVLAISSDGRPRSTVYVDRETGLLTRGTIAMTVPNVGDAPAVLDLGGYEAVDGVALPTTVTITMEGISTTTLVLERTEANTEVDASIFAVPGDVGQPETGN